MRLILLDYNGIGRHDIPAINTAGLYYWRVERLINGTPEPIQSLVYSKLVLTSTAYTPPLVNSPVTLTWSKLTPTPITSTVTHYQMRIATEASYLSPLVQENIDVSAAPTYTFTPNSVVNGTNYYWRVNGIDSSGKTIVHWGSYSFIVDNSIPEIVAPVTKIMETIPRPVFQWKSVAEATHYHIAVQNAATLTDVIPEQATTALTFIPTSDLPSGEYVLRVRASDGTTNGAWNTRAFKIALPLAAPTNLQAVGDASSVTLTWTDSNVETGLPYEVERHLPDAMALGYWRETSNTSFTDIDLGCGMIFSYRVRILRPGLTPSPWSAYVVGRTTPCMPYCPTGSDPKRVTVGSNSTLQMSYRHGDTYMAGPYVLFQSTTPLTDDYQAAFAETGELLPSFSGTLYRHDPKTCTTTAVNPTHAASPLNMRLDAVSGDGTKIAYRLRDTNEQYVYDMVQDTLTQIPFSKEIFIRSMSQDGRYLLVSTELVIPQAGVPDTNNSSDLFVYDRMRATYQAVSIGFNGRMAGGLSSGQILTANGKIFVLFNTFSAAIDRRDTNNNFDMFLRDMTRGVTVSVSLNISQDGGYAFMDRNLAVWDDELHLIINTEADKSYLVTAKISDITQGTTTLLPFKSGDGTMSENGRWLVFRTHYAILPDDTNGATDFHVYDLITGTLIRMPNEPIYDRHSLAGPNRSGFTPDGSRILLGSVLPNLVPNDTNTACEVDGDDSDPQHPDTYTQGDFNENCSDLFLIPNPLYVAPQVTLLNPVNNSVILTASPAAVAFKWAITPTGLTTFTVQVDDDPAFGSTNKSCASETRDCLISGIGHGKYFWRVLVNGDPSGSIGTFIVSPLAPRAVTLTTPSNGRPLLPAERASIVLAWNWGTQAVPAGGPFSYKVEVSRTKTFAEVIRSATDLTAPTLTTAPLVGDGAYFWRVQTVNTYGVAGAWSAPFTLIIDTAPLTNAPTPLLPINNATVSTARPAFSWTAVPGAAFYQIEINDHLTFGDAAEYTSPLPGQAGAITVTTFTLPNTVAALLQGAYAWRVRAFDAAGNAGPFSTLMPTFTVNLLNTPTAAQVFMLKGAAVSTSLPFKWSAVTGAVSYQVQIDRDGPAVPDFTGDVVTCPTVNVALATCTLTNVSQGRYAWRVLVNNQSPLASHPYRIVFVSPPAPAAPILTLPDVNATYSDVSTPSRSNLFFSRAVVTGASLYTLEIDNTPTFGTILEYSTTGVDPFNTVDLSALPAGTYYWRVKSVNALGIAGLPSTGGRAFMIDLTPPAAPLLTGPANNALLTTLRPSLTWGAVTDPSAPVRYLVDISTSESDFDANLVPGFADLAVNAATLPLTQNLPQQGIYYWRVQTVDRAGNVGPQSLVRRFTSNISVLPADNAVAAPAAINFTWASVPTATLYQVEIDTDGDFDFTTGALTLCPASGGTTATACAAPLSAGTYAWRVAVMNTTSTPVGSASGAHRTLYLKAGAGLPAPTGLRLQSSAPAPYANDALVNAQEKLNGLALVWTAPASGGLNVHHYVVEFSLKSTFVPILVSVPDASLTESAIPPAVLASDGLKYARVRAVYGSGTASSLNSAVFSFGVDTSAPAAPEIISPAGGSKASIKPVLTWKAVPGIAPINGYRLDVGTNFSITPSLPGYQDRPVTTPTYAFTTPQDLGTLFWQVRAVDVAGNISPNSPRGSFMIFLGRAPAQGAVNQLARPIFTWEGLPNVTDYVLEVVRDGDTSFTGNVFQQTITSSLPLISYTYLVGQAALSGLVYWRVYAQGTTPPAGYYASFLVAEGLTAPTLNPVGGAGAIVDKSEYPTADLTWNAPTGAGAGVYTYAIEVATNAAFTNAMTVGHASASNSTVIPLSPVLDAQPDGLKYWRVRALYMPANIYGPYSAPGTFTLDKIAPLAPVGLKVAGPVPSRPTLSWTPVAGVRPVNGYSVDISQDNFATFVTLSSVLYQDRFVSAATLSLPANLEQGTYQYRVRAYDANSNSSAYSSPMTFVVNVSKTPTDNAIVNAPVSGPQAFTWAAVPGAANYQVQIDVDQDGDFTTGALLTCTPVLATSTTCTQPALSRGTYVWRVLINGVVPPPEIARTLFLINQTALSAPRLVTLAEVGSSAPYLKDPYINASEKAQGVSVTWSAPLIEGTLVVGYDVEFGATLTFMPLLDHVDDVVGLSTAIPPAVMAADGVKYVRVRARYLAPMSVDSVPGALTAARMITVDTAGPLAPVLTAPVGTIVTSRTPALTFAPAATAARYQVELALSGAFSPTLFTASTTTPGTVIPNAQALANALHYWRVRAVDAAGNLSGFSAVGVFLVTAP